MNSLGFVEVSGVVAAVDALDIMCKSADVQLVSWERKLGGRLVTLIVTGNVSAVTAAVDAAKSACIKKPAATAIIASPHPETVRLVELSAARLRRAAEKEKAAPKAPRKRTTTATTVAKEPKEEQPTTENN